jgi:hypothetical protein
MWNYSLIPFTNGYDFSQNEIISRVKDDVFFSMVNWPIENEIQAFREIWLNRIKMEKVV